MVSAQVLLSGLLALTTAASAVSLSLDDVDALVGMTDSLRIEMGQESLQAAFSSYVVREGQCPTDLDAMINKGYLPKKEKADYTGLDYVSAVEDLNHVCKM